MDYTIELNNIRKDSDFSNTQIKRTSPIVEIFSSLVEGKDLSKFGNKADKGIEYIKSLGSRALHGDFSAMSELNSIRTYTIQPKLEQELKLLGFMGNFEALGYNESIIVESKNMAGEKSRVQTANGDVIFPTWNRERYTVPTISVSGGYVVDYRKVEFGDLSEENIGMEQVRLDIRNKAAAYVIEVIQNSIANAKGVKFYEQSNGITKTQLDDIIKKIRRFGKITLLGDYSMISQICNFAGYNGTDPVISGITESAMDEIRKTGLLGIYLGSVVQEIENMYDEARPLPDNSGFETVFPQNLMFVIPTGMTSPVRTWTRGGLTSMTGTDIKTGKYLTRFDLEIAADVERGSEYQIGLYKDLSI